MRVETEFNRREGLAIVLPDDAPAAALVAGTEIMFFEHDLTEWREGQAIVRRGKEASWVADIVAGTTRRYPEYNGIGGDGRQDENPVSRDSRTSVQKTIVVDFNDLATPPSGRRYVPLRIERVPPEVLVPGTRVIILEPGAIECEAIVQRGKYLPWVAEIIPETMHYFVA
jgi:hypothetical protein